MTYSSMTKLQKVFEENDIILSFLSRLKFGMMCMVGHRALEESYILIFIINDKNKTLSLSNSAKCLDIAPKIINKLL